MKGAISSYIDPEKAAEHRLGMAPELFQEAIAYGKKTLLYVGNLDDRVDEASLTAAFAPFGELINVELPREPNNPKHRGHAYIEFAEAEDAEHAIDNMNECEFFNRVLKVNIAKPTGLKQKAVWEEADAWYAKTLKKDAEDVDSAIRHEANKEEKEKAAAESESKEKKGKLAPDVEDNPRRRGDGPPPRRRYRDDGPIYAGAISKYELGLDGRSRGGRA